MKRVIAILLFLHLSINQTLAISLSEFREYIRSQLAAYYRINPQDLELEFLQPEQLPIDRLNIQKIKLSFDSSQIKPGLFKVWLIENSENDWIKYPVYLRVGIWKDVLIAACDIKLYEQLTPEKLAFKRVLIRNDPEKYLYAKEEVEHKMSKQQIYSGSIITPKMIKNIPDVKMGSSVKVKILYGNIVIETDGKVHQEANVGEQVSVTCEFMRRRLSGVLKSPNLVEVLIR